MYMDIRKGNADRADELSDYLSDQDMIEHAEAVINADVKELEAFVRCKIFIPEMLHKAETRPCECIWARNGSGCMMAARSNASSSPDSVLEATWIRSAGSFRSTV